MQFKKLAWQCRRGTQELDKLLIGYLENSYLNAPLSEQQQFQQLLNLEDSELLKLFFTESNANQRDLNYLVKKIRHLTTIPD